MPSANSFAVVGSETMVKVARLSFSEFMLNIGFNTKFIARHR